MLVPNRHESSNEYRYGFQGQEKDDELKGEGNSLNYEKRFYDPRIGRFLSLDPLMKKFPMLTPFQFSSNNPILNVDLDGMEGVSYRILKKDETTGKLVAIKRVIELDIYLAVEADGKKGGYEPNWANSVKRTIQAKYNEKGYLDDEGLPVEFKFNFIDFDPKSISPADKGKETDANFVETKFTHTTKEDANATPIVTSFKSRPGVTMSLAGLPGNVAGDTRSSKIRNDPEKRMKTYAFGHSECHEITHFFLQANGFTDQTPNSFDDHTLDGWMKYSKVERTMEEDGSVTTKTLIAPDFNLTKGIFDKIMQSVPKIEDKVTE